MKAQSLRIVFVALAALAIVGCQSGPRWAQMPQKLAWWKKDTPAVDNSLVARSADGVAPAVPSAPVLPSTQATPQSLTAQATPPSAKSVATVPAVTVPPISSIPATSAATIAAAPAATYPITASTIPTQQTIPAAVATAPAAATSPIPATTVAQVGPYDPNAYQPVAAPGVAAASTTSSGSTESDRYAASTVAANTIATNTAPPDQDRYAYNQTSTMPQAYATTAGNDRYGVTPTSPAAAPPTTPIAPASTPPSPPAFSPPPITPVGASTTTPAASDVATAGTVRIDAPAGQYRPGGTSTYTGASTASVEVATRPTTIPEAGVSKPLPSNVPIYPTGNTSGRAY